MECANALSFLTFANSHGYPAHYTNSETDQADIMEPALLSDGAAIAGELERHGKYFSL
jgi:hypothetical protein